MIGFGVVNSRRGVLVLVTTFLKAAGQNWPMLDQREMYPLRSCFYGGLS